MLFSLILGNLLAASGSNLNFDNLNSTEISELSYQKAEDILYNYSPQTTDLSLLLYYLEYSANNSNPDALRELGEIWLFGLPIAPENPARGKFADNNGKFNRNIGKAIDYFQKAFLLGDADSAFYLAFLLEQTLLISDFDEYFTEVQDAPSMIESLYNIGLSRDSYLTQKSLLSAYKQCISSYEITTPSLLSSNISHPFYSAPLFNKMDCGGSCEDYGIYAMDAAEDALEYIKENGREELRLGRLDLELKNMYGEETERALKLATISIKQSDYSHGYINLAENYMFGNPRIGIEKDYEKAIELYTTAALSGNIDAIDILGIIYSQGIHTEKDIDMGLSFLEKAKARESPQAYSTLGYLYFNGDGIPADKVKALDHIMTAAEKGNPEAMNNLGVLYAKGDGVTQDYFKAVQMFSAGSVIGHAPSLFNLGLMHFKGFGTKKSCRLSLDLFDKVIERGDLAKVLLNAYWYYRNDDIEGAYLSYMLGSALGFEDAQLSVGYMWEKGMVNLRCKYDRDYCAMSYYAKAAQMHQSEWAFYKLGDRLYYNSRNEIDYIEAFKFYSDAKTVPEAIFSKAYMIEFGIGVEKNETKAEAIYEDIIKKSKNGQNERDSYYPAQIALYTIKLKRLVSQIPFFDSFVEMVNSIFN